MGGPTIPAGKTREQVVQEQNVQQNTPRVSTDVGAIQNSGITQGSAAQNQINANLSAAAQQNKSLAAIGDPQAIRQLLDTPELATSKDLQNSVARGILIQNGFGNPNQNLIDQLIAGTLRGRNAKGGNDYTVNLNESLGISDSVSALKKANIGLGDILGLSDTLTAKKNLDRAGSLISNSNQTISTNQDRVKQINQTLPQLDQQIAQAEANLTASVNSQPRFTPSDFPDQLRNLRNLQSQRDTLTKELSSLSNQNSFYTNVSNVGKNTQQKATQDLFSSLAGVSSASKPQIIPQAFAQQQGKQFNVNLSESLGVSTGKNNDLVSGIGGGAQDPFGKPSEATEGFGFVSLSPSDLLGGNRENINRINRDVTQLANTPGLESITVDFGNGNKKTYQPQQALGGILSDLTSVEGKAEPGSNFGLNLVGNFAPTTKPLSSQERQQQKQSFQINQNNLLGSLATAKAKGITSLDITDQTGKVIGTTNPQDTTRARYDILKASLSGPVSVKGEVTTTSTSATPGKFVDLSNMDYSQLVDIGAVSKPQTPLEYLNYYGGVFERPLKNPVESLVNTINQKVNPKAEPLYNISPTTSDVFFGAVQQAGVKKLSDIGYYKALGIKPDIDITSETRGPQSILSQESSKGVQSILNDPFRTASEIPGEIGSLIIATKLLGYGTQGASALSGKIGESIRQQSIKSATERGLREGQLEFQVAKPKGKDIFEFEQGTAGKSGKVSEVIPQEFGIGPKGEKVPQLNIPEEIKIPNPAGEGQAKIPLAFINPEKEGSILVARSEPQNVLPPNRFLIKGVEPKLADILGLKPVKGQNDLYVGAATTENTPLIEGAVDTGKIAPVTDFFETYTKDFMKNPEVFGLFAKEPKTLIPKNENYPFQSFTRPNIIRYYEGFQGGFERAKYSPGLERRIATNELYPRIRAETQGYIDLTAFNPRDFSIVGVGSKGLDRYLTDLGLSPKLRKRDYTSRKSSLASGVSKSVSDRYPLMKSGITQQTEDMIRDIAYGYKPLPKGKAVSKEETPLYPLPGLSEQTKQANRKATQQEDQQLAFEILGYPKQQKQTFADVLSFKKSPGESRTKTVEIHKQIGGQFSGLNIINPLEQTKNKSKSAIDLILSLKPAQGIKGRGDQTNKILQNILQTPIQGSKSTQRSDVVFKYKYEQAQKTQQQNKFVDVFDFTTPPQPKVSGQLPQFQWPDIRGLSTPGKKHGSRNKASFFGYTVNPNKPGDIADINFASGKYVGTKPVKLRFSGNKLDSLLGTSAYSKRKSKKGLDLL